ncbi:L-ribulose-5-phosphate 4-epimerase [Terrimicrobium sacchariphilum]|uniref:L-ribulose-5-phosphate 4-epimerase n=1 Tax=Terrimicrobium sacchariphilum TaxID=690879 RepID=A0A146G6V9_TERSA|nr:L-ribulose-5-phosphate 4-epimerase [Terrimicrobium sacchariphilum]
MRVARGKGGTPHSLLCTERQDLLRKKESRGETPLHEAIHYLIQNQRRTPAAEADGMLHRGEKAGETAFALEIVAEMAMKTLHLNQAASSVSQPLLDRHFFRKHGAGAYYGQA